MAPILVSVPWGDTVSYDGPREASAVLRAAAPADAMPQAAMQLLAGGKLLRGSDRVPASCLTATVVLSGLKGGKGGCVARQGRGIAAPWARVRQGGSTRRCPPLTTRL